MKKNITDIISLVDDTRYNNILDQDSRFKYLPFGDVSGITKVGDFMWYEVYLDILMPSGEILISYDKSISRDNKLDHILDNMEILKEKRVRIF